MSRSPVLTTSLIALVAGLLGGAPAQADPLVSGYGGPGSGDQTVLGSKLLGGGGGGGKAGAGGGSERTSIRATAAAPAVPALTPVPRAAQADTRSGQRGAAQGRSSAQGRSGAQATPRGEGSPAPAAANTGANTSAGPLPVDGSDLLIIFAVLVGLGLAALASARLAHSQRTPA